MGQLKQYEHQVFDILLHKPETRDSDYLLMYEYCKSKHIDLHISAGEYFLAHKEHRFPNWESLTRARRKVQEKYPELRKNTYNKRQEKQEEYIEYALEED